MEMLYAPWREDYATTIGQSPTGKENAGNDVCIFCNLQKQTTDDENFILKRYNHCYLILNRYPYNPGHLLVIPYEHRQNIFEVSDEVRIEMMQVLNTASQVLNKEMNCNGINIGLNMGKAAGAGMPSHLHWHILPRWFGDTNFLPILSGVKTVSTDLPALYKKLLHYF